MQCFGFVSINEIDFSGFDMRFCVMNPDQNVIVTIRCCNSTIEQKRRMEKRRAKHSIIEQLMTEIQPDIKLFRFIDMYSVRVSYEKIAHTFEILEKVKAERKDFRLFFPHLSQPQCYRAMHSISSCIFQLKHFHFGRLFVEVSVVWFMRHKKYCNKPDCETSRTLIRSGFYDDFHHDFVQFMMFDCACAFLCNALSS